MITTASEQKFNYLVNPSLLLNNNDITEPLPELNFTLPVNDISSFNSYPDDKLIAPLALFKDPEAGQAAKNAPSFAEVRKGKVIGLNQEGPAVKELQQRLGNAGFPMQITGVFGETTLKTLKKFQEKYGLTPTGSFGPTSLAALETAEKAKKAGETLAREAKTVARTRNTIGWCYNAVATAIEKVNGRFLYGESAYMAASQFAAHPGFKELKVKAGELPKLPAGAIVVWGKTAKSPDGHISIALGNGMEASDHIEPQRTNLRGYSNFRVFMPVKG